MADLDFDELDKAVNTLMQDATNPVNSTLTQPSAGTPPSPVSTTTPTITMVTEVSDQKPVTVQSLSQRVMTPRRRGQFMDFMSTPKTKQTVTPQLSAHQTRTIEPVPLPASPSVLNNSNAGDGEKDDTGSTSTNLVTVSVQQMPVEDLSVTAEGVADIDKVSDERADEAPVASILNKETTEVDVSTQNSDGVAKKIPDIPQDTLQTSPFIPDAQVEKRPLGSPQVPSQPRPTSILPVRGDGDLPVELHPDLATLEAEPAVGAESLEVKSELPQSVELEVGGDIKLPQDVVQASSAKATVGAVPVATEELKVDSPPSPETKVEAVEFTAEVASDVSASSDTSPIEKENQGSASSTTASAIAQQYSEQLSSSDATNGSIYDTEQYHQPIQRFPKKKSGFMVIIWIIVLALLGVAVAAGYYFLTMR